uniref:NADH dehydrogenase subunit 4L n=2 Tax=unclassified Hiatella TaxID=2619785 RepID=A0AA51UHZ3_9BIVA|nr:NADH dehydrogenase subunit 4L [Hiatella sp. J HML-2015]WMW23649.1 NADH dehydrogenase subunit 4L [Hiatella sp. J YW-2023]
MGLYLIFINFMLISLLILLKEVDHFLSVLVASELLLLSAFGLSSVLGQSYVPASVLGGFSVVILCLGVCESCMGLGILTSMGRHKGGSKVYNLSSFKL